MRIEDYSEKYIHYYTEEVPEFIVSIFNNYKIRSLADLGSGDGAVLYALFKNGYLGKVDKIVAVDISDERIDNAKKIDTKIEGVVSDVCNLEMISASSMDLVMSSQVIEHLPEEERFIKEVYRILSTDGLFYLSTVFKKWYGWYFYRCNGRWTLDPTHLREYTHSSQLLNILKKYSFVILEHRKTLHWFPVTDFILKRVGVSRDIYKYKILHFLRKIRIPILGYYNWELVLKK